jgi:hypothetical protein
MTDRLNDAPGGDLTDDELAAANDLAAAEVEEDAAGGDTLAESEEIDEELDEGDSMDLEGDLDGAGDDEARATPRPKGARARAAEAAAARASRSSKGPRPTRTAFPIDPALRIKDPASSIFVLVSIGFFVLVFLNAMALGKGGAFTQVPTPTPYVSPSPGPIVSPGPTDTPVTTAPTAS